MEKALHNGPQFVTKHGSNAVVVISFEEYQKMSKPKEDLVSFLRSSPLAEVELDVIRDKSPARDIDL